MRSADRTTMGWLLAKEARQLGASPPWWLLLALTGPLVGLAFTGAVESYSEVSAGTGASCGAVCTPLVGIWAPTFGAYEVAAVLLLPFVAIRQVSGDRQSGALALERQLPVAPALRAMTKALVLLAGWAVTLAAAGLAVLLWKFYGGGIAAGELAVAVLGQALNATMTIALAIAVATVTDHPSTAAIVVLALTLGTWAIDLAGALYGGAWTTIAASMPAAMVANFSHGLVRLDLVVIMMTMAVAGIVIAALWTRLGPAPGRRTWETAAVVAGAMLVIAAAPLLRASWDASDARLNSFAEADEQLLARVASPLSVDIHLSPQDPRRAQFERGPLAKLRRTVSVRVTYTSRTTSGIYEQADAGYGEIRYGLGDRHDTTRVITDEGTLEALYELAGVPAPDEAALAQTSRPLVTQPAGARWTLYLAWPLLVAGAAIRVSRRRRS